MPTERILHELLELAKRDKTCVAEIRDAVTRAAAIGLGVDRAGIWRLADEQAALVCEASYQQGAHVSPASLGVLCAVDHPRYFAALSKARTVAVSDAPRDPRTADLTPDYLVPHGITAMLDVPIWDEGMLYGVLCSEHRGGARTWSASEIFLATNLADVVSISLEAARRRAAERRWEVVAEAMEECLIVLSERGEVTHANRAARALWRNVGGGELLPGDLFSGDGLYEPIDLEGNIVPLDRRPTARLRRGESLEAEIAGIRLLATGEERYFRLTASALGGGEEECYVVVLADVTHELRFERVKRDFLSMLAHELKTPVTIAKGYVHVLGRGDPPLGDPLRAIVAIRRATDRMDALVQELLDATSILVGRFLLTREPADLSDLVARAIAKVGDASPHHEFHLRAPEVAPVVVDAARMEHAIRQLLDNAVRLSPKDGGIEVVVEPRGAWIEVRVRDEGIGYATDELERVFEAFYLARAGISSGLGLGLFLAREIARAHGGDVVLASTPGGGTLVTLTLPAAGLLAGDVGPGG